MRSSHERIRPKVEPLSARGNNRPLVLPALFKRRNNASLIQRVHLAEVQIPKENMPAEGRPSGEGCFPIEPSEEGSAKGLINARNRDVQR